MANGDELKFGQGLSVIFYEVNDANPSPYNQTVFWLNAQYYLKFIKDEKDGKKETLIPGRGKLETFKTSFNNLKRKIEEKKPLQKMDLKFLPVLPEFKFSLESNNVDKESAYGSNSSDISVSSQSSAEKNNHIQRDKPKKFQSRISRSDTKALLFNNHSRNENPKIFKFDIEGRLIILSQAHPFLKNIDPKRRKVPQSYRNAFRIDNLTDKELQDLTDNYLNKAIAVGKPNFRA